MSERPDPLESALRSAWNQGEPEGPECHLCGNPAGPWLPDPSGSRWPSGAQKLICSRGCKETAPAVAAPIVIAPGQELFLAEYDGETPTLHLTLTGAQDWCNAKAADEAPGQSADWITNDGAHELWTVHPSTDRPMHRAGGTVTPLVVEGGTV